MSTETSVALLTTGEAARILVVCPDTVREFERRGQLHAQRTLSGLRLFDRGEVERLAQQRARQRRGGRDAA